MLSIGQEVNVMIIDIDTDHHRISLGIKQCEPNPWEEFSNKYRVGDVLEGKVKNTTEFGIFVEFESGIDGLTHISDIDNNEEKAKGIIKQYKKGDPIKIVLLGSNAEQERISLGLKQLSNEHFKEDVDKLDKGLKTPCVIKSIKKDFMEVEIELGLKGIIKRIDVSSDKKEQRTDKFNVGDKLDATIVSFKNTTGKLILTLKDLAESEKNLSDDDDFDIEQYMNTDTGTTLGSVLASAIEEAKNR